MLQQRYKHVFCLWAQTQNATAIKSIKLKLTALSLCLIQLANLHKVHKVQPAEEICLIIHRNYRPVQIHWE